MNWIAVVVAGHFLNAVAFLMDKFLLTKKIPSPSVYAFFIGALGILSLVLVPFGFSIPSGGEIARALIAGATFVGALIFFFSALKENEASRVVPLVGGLVPVCTVVLAYLFLNERLRGCEIAAFVLLLLGGVLISLEKGKRGTGRGYGFAVLAGAAFAISFVITKQVYSEQEFISGFIWSRFGGFLAALAILLFPANRQAIFNQKKEKGSAATFGLFLTGQVSGAAGFVLVNYALSLASVSLVNAMQGVQYAFLLLMMLLLSKKYPHILSERLSGKILFQKIAAIALISAGIVLIAV